MIQVKLTTHPTASPSLPQIPDTPVPSSNNFGMPTTSPSCEDLKITAYDDYATTYKNTPVDIHVLGNDTHPLITSQQTTRYLISEDDSTNNPTLVISKLHFTGRFGECTHDGLLVEYTPTKDFYGQDVCVYEVCDPNNPRIQCDIALITITVLSSSGVMAIDDYVETSKNVAIEVYPLLNDKGAEGYTLTTMNVTNTDNTVGECVLVNENVVLYIPKPDWVGIDECEYVMCDTREKCDGANIIVDVVGEPDGPCDDDDDDMIDTSEPTTRRPSNEPSEKPTTRDPTTSQPTLPQIPETNDPSKSPTYKPVGDEVFSLEPTLPQIPETYRPSTLPTDAPTAKPISTKPPTDRKPPPTVSSEPTSTPSSSSPVSSEPTTSPSLFPVSSEPTSSPSSSPVTPVTSEPTSNPSLSPVFSEETQSPSNSPVTNRPTNRPTKERTRAPVTSSPSTDSPTVSLYYFIDTAVMFGSVPSFYLSHLLLIYLTISLIIVIVITQAI